jgi:hypothetical protein
LFNGLFASLHNHNSFALALPSIGASDKVQQSSNPPLPIRQAQHVCQPSFEPGIWNGHSAKDNSLQKVQARQIDASNTLLGKGIITLDSST